MLLNRGYVQFLVDVLSTTAVDVIRGGDAGARCSDGGSTAQSKACFHAVIRVACSSFLLKLVRSLDFNDFSYYSGMILLSSV